ncbi:malate dehydrogenase (oxaloacetate-decarboxylating)(NADP+) [Cohaesibacter gelatinilyticus]|uniref:Malate dehydrogenase (Oxaloacetate-decarboxylating)(NADP+) n=2 Tax=Cohaesibacter gelatinilyticus TaxID=372072 RepID=A0A285NK52_9HYPH|nr:malate dehydrogenase (oxaloacetate-decarboxylating)(NADP+) [Cohaesibacter gelatinilyticus]
MSDTRSEKNELDEAACFYHSYPQPGKLEIAATKPLGNQRDLALAYSPGVAAPCVDIAKDPGKAFDYTARGNLVAVVSNGTAVLGLGPIGPLASKPVMEGKAVLFKKFAGVDVFDIEVDETGIDKFVDVVTSLEPTFGGINLEDIKAPECFEIERKCRERMDIPVFHDDQHGTAIIVGAAAMNGMEHAGKSLENAKIVASGAGAAALACLNLLVSLGARRENIWVTDIDGVVYEGREQMDEWKGVFAQKTDLRTLDDVIDGADIFLGLSAGGVLKPHMVERMAKNPLIMALANPNPEILPEDAQKVRPDAMLCTGRSDYPNQVNNVLCFPYIFRGALDVEATAINEEMKHAVVKAIAGLAREEISDVAAQAADGKLHPFGPNYLIPTPFDPRLILRIAPAVAKAAMDTGVAKRPIEDFEAYQERLRRFVFRSGLIMKNMVAKAKSNPKRVVYADGEDERVLRAAQIAIEDGLAEPILIGRPDVMRMRAERFGLKFRPGDDCEIINPQDDPRYRQYVDEYLECVGRKGVNPQGAATVVRVNTTVIAALTVKRGDADAMITGLDGRFRKHLREVTDILGLAEDMHDYSALSLLINSKGAYFLTDTYVSEDPSAEEIAETTINAAEHIRRFGITPKVALLSASNFGSREFDSSAKMREAVNLIWERAPDLEVDGEMHGDVALSSLLRDRVMPKSKLSGEANLLVFPNLDSANIALNLMKVMTDALHVGPILMGASKPAHILTPSVTSRGVTNMTALASVDAQSYYEKAQVAGSEDE